MNEGAEVAGKLVASATKASPAFQTTAEVLHLVTLPVEFPVEATLLSAVGFAREAVAGIEFLKLLAQLVAVEAFVPNEHQTVHAGQRYDLSGRHYRRRKLILQRMQRPFRENLELRYYRLHFWDNGQPTDY